MLRNVGVLGVVCLITWYSNSKNESTRVGHGVVLWWWWGRVWYGGSEIGSL